MLDTPRLSERATLYIALQHIEALLFQAIDCSRPLLFHARKITKKDIHIHHAGFEFEVLTSRLMQAGKMKVGAWRSCHKPNVIELRHLI
jgi:hypothetical protein